MNCRDVRRLLDDPSRSEQDRAFREHLGDCEECRRLHEKMGRMRAALRERHAGVTPDPGFASRVGARLSKQPVDLLGWAALRVLPATLVILAFLSWAVFTGSPAATTTAPTATTAQAASTSPSPTEDLFGWVLEETENGS